MDKLIVACAQQQMRLFDSADGYRRELIRFLNMARAKGAKLIVFPPLTGVMATSHAVEGFRVNLLKQAGARPRGAPSFWRRTRTAVAEGTAALLGASYRRTYIAVLQDEAERLGGAYFDLFAELARTYEMTIVAGSAFLPVDAADEAPLRHRVTVFGPDGASLGGHDKVILSPEDAGIAIVGATWHAIETPVGRLGILFEEEALYPEIGRILAYERADILITLAAVGNEALSAYIRHAVLAQAQANRCFAISAFLVGRNYLAAEEGSAAAFSGKSGIYAPLEMTPRYSGVLVEMGTSEAEGLLTAELDREQLTYLWERGVPSVRKAMPVDLFATALSPLYASGRTLDMAWHNMLPEVLALPAPAEEVWSEEIETLGQPVQPAESEELMEGEWTPVGESWAERLSVDAPPLDAPFVDPESNEVDTTPEGVENTETATPPDDPKAFGETLASDDVDIDGADAEDADADDADADDADADDADADDADADDIDADDMRLRV